MYFVIVYNIAFPEITPQSFPNVVLIVGFFLKILLIIPDPLHAIGLFLYPLET